MADFGLARNMGEEPSRGRQASTLSSQSIHMTSNVCFLESHILISFCNVICQVGSIRYCAPELLTVDNLALYNEQADVYVAKLLQTFTSTKYICADILLE